MKKGLVFGVLFLIGIFLMASVFAATNTTNTSTSSSSSSSTSNSEGEKKAYECLGNQIKDKTSFSLEESVFGVLALGSEKKLTDTIENNKKSNENCWPKDACKLKETAQVMLAYDRLGKDTNGIKSWLVSKKAAPGDLNWYLEIDTASKGSADCTIKYDSEERKIKIKDDMTLEGSGGSCLTIANSGYWLKVKDTCYQKEFQVSCNQDFITTLVYQKTGSSTIFVSPETHSASSLGQTAETVNSYCFKNGNNCDYEGSLWATLALQKDGEEVDSYIPYLLALSEDNKKFFPSSFLYIVKSGEDQYSEVAQSQKQSKYWEMSGGVYNRFYDTALGMLSLAGTGATELDNAKNYLLGIQTKEGCWSNNNIRDTAFILYAGWPKSVSGGSSGGGGTLLCQSAGKYCESSISCLEAEGTILNEYECTNFREVCCSVEVKELTCTEKNGVVCSSNQECTGRVESSSNGNCCLAGSCVAKEEKSACEVTGGGSCRSSCLDTEDELTYSCTDSADVCCAEKTTTETSGISWIWISLLIVLIVLLALAILYRNNIRTMWFRFRGNARVSPSGPRGPPPSGAAFPRQPFMQQRPFGQPMPGRMPPQQRRPVEKDSEMEETMRKLKEMSK